MQHEYAEIKRLGERVKQLEMIKNDDKVYLEKIDVLEQQILGGASEKDMRGTIKSFTSQDVRIKHLEGQMVALKKDTEQKIAKSFGKVQEVLRVDELRAKQ